jgi:hypothetical protein
MATLKGPIQFTGSMGGLRSYYDRDSGKQILATKREGNKKAFKNCKSLERVKDMNREFTACNIWALLVRMGTADLCYLKNGRINGKLVSIAKQIQRMIGKDILGYRRIESSTFNSQLVGFCMNNAHPFNLVCNVDPVVSISEDRREVSLALNDFTSFGRFHWPESISHYRVYLNIFILPDVEWDEGHRQYFPAYPSKELGNKTCVSEWIPLRATPIDFQISAAFDENKLPKEKTVVIVSLGFEFASGMQYSTPYVVKDYGTMAIVGCF